MSHDPYRDELENEEEDPDDEAETGREVTV